VPRQWYAVCDRSGIAASSAGILFGVRGLSESGDLIVSSVRPDPIPEDAIGMILAKCTVTKPDASGPNAADLLESNGWVSGIGFEKLEVLVGEFTDWFWQLAMGEPRTPVRRSGSKRRAAPGLVVGFRTFACRVEPPGTDVGLNLSVPFLGYKTLKPLRERGKILFGQARNGCFEFLNAHVEKLRLKRQSGNRRFCNTRGA
jgi:hypothetical protein